MRYNRLEWIIPRDKDYVASFLLTNICVFCSIVLVSCSKNQLSDQPGKVWPGDLLSIFTCLARTYYHHHTLFLSYGYKVHNTKITIIHVYFRAASFIQCGGCNLLLFLGSCTTVISWGVAIYTQQSLISFNLDGYYTKTHGCKNEHS